MTNTTVLSNSVKSSLEQTLARLDGALGVLLRGGALALVLSATGCAVAPVDGDEAVDEADQALIGNGQTDWAQQQGQRNPTMVSYYGESWWSYNYSSCNSRFCPTMVDLFLKIRLKPVAGADLNWKKAGVVYRAPGTNELKTVNAYYFTTWGNGDEEWHVKITLPASTGLISFNAWYEDGASHTYFDDNNTELHAATIGSGTVAILQMGGSQFTNLVVDDRGAHGTISARVADIDYDKEIAMIYSTDGWLSSHWLDIGPGVNGWHWIEDYGSDYERWGVDVDIPGNFHQIQYAIVYRHGVAGAPKKYEFWDNNYGQNYLVTRSP